MGCHSSVQVFIVKAREGLFLPPLVGPLIMNKAPLASRPVLVLAMVEGARHAAGTAHDVEQSRTRRTFATSAKPPWLAC